MMPAYEKLGAFYLGKAYDPASHRTTDEMVLYDAKDLTTHAVIIGMTGSGKTGLGIGMLEEALIDNVPVIAIDPKGDLPNLLLSFPELRPSDFLPWINRQDALTHGLSPDAFAARQADLWRKGLADWQQDSDRIARLKDAAEFAVYTPGSSAGQAVNVLRTFAPPPAAIQQDGDLMQERIQTTVTSLLALLGIEADPLSSREHILIANLFEFFWSSGKGLDLAGLIRAVQTPPINRIGVMDLEAIYPSGDRFALAMRLNNLLAAPGFESWLEGDPLEVGRLLYTSRGKPRASIFCISHLSDTERMFFVSLLLNEVLGWMRTQTGTTSLRAVLYMDEIFGYFPPVKNPPSKAPLLTLLKQARAYGLGVVLATQNPVDLDYKGLSNTGTWFIGRLQTERDKLRVLEGLEGAAGDSGFDRGRMQEIIAGLDKRVFLLHNVHENSPAIFQTRWTLSYLRGPMTREQIKDLTTLNKSRADAPAAQPESLPDRAALLENDSADAPLAADQPPPAAPGIDVYFFPASGAGAGLIYKPAVAGWLDVHYAQAKYKVETSQKAAFAAELTEGPVGLTWEEAVEVAMEATDLESSPLPGAEFSDLPSVGRQPGAYKKWRNDLLRWLRQKRPLVLFSTGHLGLTSLAGESEAEFRVRLTQAAREKRDLEAEKLRRNYSARFSALQNRLLRAQQAVDREQEQARSRKMETVISFGTAILGAFMGRKVVSSTSAYRVGTAMKSAGRMQKEKMDVARAHETVEAVQQQLAELDGRLEADIAKLDMLLDPSRLDLEEVRVTPKSSDITLKVFGLVWMPYRKNAQGRLSPDWR